MNRQLQRFWPLIIGLSLPILLIVFVLAIQITARWNAPPVTTPVLYWPDASYWIRPQVHWSVTEGRLEMIYTENRLARANQPERSIRLWLYRPRSGESTSFDIELPVAVEDGERVALELPEALEDLTLDTSLESPEGYRFEISSGSGRGLFVELFGGYRSRMAYQLVGHGSRHRLPEKGRYLADGAFIAWVVNDDENERRG